MKNILSLIILIAIFKVTSAIQCADINFNDGQLHLTKCTGSVSWMPPWAVLAFENKTDFKPRDEKTTHYIAKPSGSWSDVCGETESYVVDEYSYVVVGFYIEKLSVQGYGDIILELFIDGDKEIEKKIPYTNTAQEWREEEINVTKSGSLMVRLTLGTNENTKSGLDYIKIYNQKSDIDECKPQLATTTNIPSTPTSKPTIATSESTIHASTTPTTTIATTTTSRVAITTTNLPTTTTDKPSTTTDKLSTTTIGPSFTATGSTTEITTIPWYPTTSTWYPTTTTWIPNTSTEPLPKTTTLSPSTNGTNTKPNNSGAHVDIKVDIDVDTDQAADVDVHVNVNVQ